MMLKSMLVPLLVLPDRRRLSSSEANLENSEHALSLALLPAVSLVAVLRLFIGVARCIFSQSVSLVAF
jgi:hypothetical protein